MSDEQRATPTLREVLAWRDKALMYLATYSNSPLPPDVAEAINSLAQLARRALDEPTPDGLIWALRNDPIAYAAYTLGRQHADQPEVPNLRIERGGLADMPRDLEEKLRKQL